MFREDDPAFHSYTISIVTFAFFIVQLLPTAAGVDVPRDIQVGLVWGYLLTAGAMCVPFAMALSGGAAA